jgi:hypothetical protein
MNILLEGNIVEDSARFLPLVSIVLFQKAPDALPCGQKGIQTEEEGLRFTRGLLAAFADEVLKKELSLASFVSVLSLIHALHDPPQLARLGLGGLPGAGMKLGLAKYSYLLCLSEIW